MEKDKINAPNIREMIASADSKARGFVAELYDEGTFLELGTYVKSKDKAEALDGVITGCGAVDGRLVFSFIQDISNGRAAFSFASAKKIASLYDSAMRAKAPVVGVYTSAGAVLAEGIDVISGYGLVLAKMSKAKGVIPQISVISGACGGGAAVAASSADFIIADGEKGELYINSRVDEKQKRGVPSPDITAPSAELVSKTKELLNCLPSNNTEGTVYTLAPDDINVPTENTQALVCGDVRELISQICDNRKYLEIGEVTAKEMVCALSAINGKVVGVIANQPTANDGALTEGAARKAAGFASFLADFNIPLLTLVNTVGFEGDDGSAYASALSSLCMAYTKGSNPKVTVVTGKAYGSAFAVLGSKRLGADMVFALDSAVISVMAPESAVEFIWDDKVRAAEDAAAARTALLNEWKEGPASPVSAARLGDIDDIISFSEIKQRIAAGFEILGG